MRAESKEGKGGTNDLLANSIDCVIPFYPAVALA